MIYAIFQLISDIYSNHGTLTEARDYIGGMVFKKESVDEPNKLFYMSHDAGRAYLTESKEMLLLSAISTLSYTKSILKVR